MDHLDFDWRESTESTLPAPSVVRALELMRSLRPDVALMDSRLMTSIDGLQTTRQARPEQLPPAW